MTVTRWLLKWRVSYDVYVMQNGVMCETSCPARVNGGWLSVGFGPDVSHGQQHNRSRIIRPENHIKTGKSKKSTQ